MTQNEKNAAIADIAGGNLPQADKDAAIKGLQSLAVSTPTAAQTVSEVAAAAAAEAKKFNDSLEALSAANADLFAAMQTTGFGTPRHCVLLAYFIANVKTA